MIPIGRQFIKLKGRKRPRLPAPEYAANKRSASHLFRGCVETGVPDAFLASFPLSLSRPVSARQEGHCPAWQSSWGSLALAAEMLRMASGARPRPSSRGSRRRGLAEDGGASIACDSGLDRDIRRRPEQCGAWREFVSPREFHGHRLTHLRGLRQE
jgi:hypothetical protein